MYRVIKIYNDGLIVEGKYLYHGYCLDELLSLLEIVHPVTYEISVALEIE